MFYPHMNVQSNSSDAAANHAASLARGASSDVDLMKFDVERLLMITEALWTMLKEQHGYDDTDLIKRVTEIDMRDGRLDGKVAATEAPTCPACNRKSMKHRLFCIYCGAPIKTDLFQR